MNLRVRDRLIFWLHCVLAKTGRIQAAALEDIRRDGFKRILVVATTAIGDAVLCAPLLKSLKNSRPDLHLGFWVQNGAVPLFEGLCGADVVLPYHGKYRCVRETLKDLRNQRFDLALIANANDPDIIPLLWWSGCRRLIRRPQRNTIYHFMIANPEMLSPSHTTGHAIERNLQFCDLLGLPRGEARTRLMVKPEADERVRAILNRMPKPWICIHPGASQPRKQWPADRFAALARRILDRTSGTVVLTGSRGEQQICHQVAGDLGGDRRLVNLAGILRLDELAALFHSAGLLISGDTGPYHIGMAVDVPTVTLFAPWDVGSSPAINGPAFDLQSHRAVATAAIGDPITSIEVDRVFRECEPFLFSRPDGGE
ncbi:MAG: glycosyltransferase family 9 protein [Verrucomicrobiae bacterium]|nr:glycosyltransferase family 9 protein [Verrucomicrobiae bacterium]